MNKKVAEVTIKELRKIALVGTHLHKWQGFGEKGVIEVFQNQGMIQVDPLNPAGRNHDIFLFARIPDYSIHSFQKIVYPKRLVFEAYFPNLMVISAEYFRYFFPNMKMEKLHEYYQKRLRKIENKHPGYLEQAKNFLRKNGPSRAQDIADMAKTKPSFSFWKTSNLAGIALETLWLIGEAAIYNRDEFWRKTYSLISDYFEETFLEKVETDDKEIEYRKFLLRQKSFPLINLGKISLTSKKKLVLGKKKNLSPEWFEREEDISPQILKAKELSISVAAPYNWEKLLDQKLDEEMRAIAPLDPLIWDRDLLKKIFNFNYSWEVYKLPKDRKWGYYVYPLLYKGDFIGRVEVKYEKKSSTLRVFNLQLEEKFEYDSASEKALENLLSRWKKMVKAEHLSTDKTLDVF
ncbi:MAG: DNA glycosylase AlkZ-like family protein [Candidatus Heimdallarchaeaceae archaeon]